jgi:hypothetical protein
MVATMISPAIAQTQQQTDFDWCTNKGRAYSTDMRVNGCSELIRSGRTVGHDLAVALSARGYAYYEKRDYEKAIADFNHYRA